jgi:hypothetical protein
MMGWWLPEEGEDLLDGRVRMCHDEVVAARSLLLGRITRLETGENTSNGYILMVPCSPQAGVTALVHNHERWWQKIPK